LVDAAISPEDFPQISAWHFNAGAKVVLPS